MGNSACCAESKKHHILHENRRPGVADAERLRRLFERVPCEALALGAHIVAAQFAERIGHEFGGDSLAPGHVEISIVEWLGDSSRECGGFFNGLLTQGAA